MELTSWLVPAAPITYLWLILTVACLGCFGADLLHKRWEHAGVFAIAALLFLIEFSCNAQIAELQFLNIAH